MTLLQQRRLAHLRSQLDRAIDQRDGTLDRLCRLTLKVKSLTKAIDRAQKRAAVMPKPVPVVITPPAPEPAPAPVAAPLDDGIPDFLRRPAPDAAGKAIAAENEQRRKTKSQVRIEKLKAKKSGDTKKMPLEGKDALKVIFG